ncbi:hypothetical protein MNBD_GAMMA09-2439 [hydrothermal vent metagenome]|uniref:Uncharacterized protein n=1 Tax=hydrothermal vent metagenome TaxID=652676 RepID=A0A3B0Y194_9ZZZZ
MISCVLKKLTILMPTVFFILLSSCEGYGGDASAGISSCVTPDLFVDKVWLSMESNCVICHQPGVIGSKLIFNPLETVEYNYRILRSYTLVDANKLRGKSVGQFNHGGQAPYIDINSQEYKDLDALIILMLEECI